MKFCDKCGSYMQRTKDGFSCSQCGNKTVDDAVRVRRIERREPRAVHVIDVSTPGYVKVNERCPHCGNVEVFRYASFVSGEHAGIRQERSLERLKCPKCGYAWTRG